LKRKQKKQVTVAESKMPCIWLDISATLPS